MASEIQAVGIEPEVAVLWQAEKVETAKPLRLKDAQRKKQSVENKRRIVGIFRI